MRKFGWRAIALTVSMLLVGCGQSLGASASTRPPTPRPRAASAPKLGAAPTSDTLTASLQSAPPFYEVRTRRVKGLGTVLVNGQGLTLYMFVPDKRSGRSTCYKMCAEAWPPLRLPTGVTKPVAGRGVKASLLGTTHRTDGTLQVTYNRWPLYLWVGDSEPGQATGQALNNLGGLWYVLSPKGNFITTP